MPDDMKKHLLIKEQHPDLDIRFVFQNPNSTNSKRTKTTYANWCDKHGFKYCGIGDRRTIDEWLSEIPAKESEGHAEGVTADTMGRSTTEE